MLNMKKTQAYTKILTVAEKLIQTKGYNAFSFHDIASSVGIKTASIHYHFPTKADLGKAVVKYHIDSLNKQLETFISNPKLSHAKKLTVFLDTIFSSTYLNQKRMCLGGMLAADTLTLPKKIQNEVKHFFETIRQRLEKLLQEGANNKEFHLKSNKRSEAEGILAILEGAILLARLYEDEKILLTAKKQISERLLKK